MRSNVPQVFQTFFLRREFLARRPSEDLRSSLPLSALPVLARKGFFWGVLAAFFRSWAVLGRLGRSWSALGMILGRSWAVLGGSWVLLGRSWLLLGWS